MRHKAWLSLATVLIRTKVDVNRAALPHVAFQNPTITQLLARLTCDSTRVTTRISPPAAKTHLSDDNPGGETLLSRLGSATSHTNSTEKVTQAKSSSVFCRWHENKPPRRASPENFPKLRNSLRQRVCARVCVRASVRPVLLLSHDLLSISSTGSWRWAAPGCGAGRGRVGTRAGLSNTRSLVRVSSRARVFPDVGLKAFFRFQFHKISR